ncbi:MAG: ISAs1 family transposase [Candidatus Accumulibacter sp.]|jgi:hypothetical protein|nr:ISAs1 family transposase [Accumulibacter sp.]
MQSPRLGVSPIPSNAAAPNQAIAYANIVNSAKKSFTFKPLRHAIANPAKESAQEILERGGDYLLAVKENQPSLAEALREFFDEGETRGYGRLPVSRHERVEKDHGRIETRRALWINDLFWMDAPLREHWPKLSGVGMLERTRSTAKELELSRAFGIESAPFSQDQLE